MAKWLKFYATYTLSTSLMLLHYLVKHKSTKFHSFSGKLCKNSVKTSSYFHQYNNFWETHDKIAGNLCLVLKVCPAPRRPTQALKRRRHWPRYQHPRSTSCQSVPLV